MEKFRKLAVVVSHPIQYYSPFFKLLSNEIPIKVFYSLGERSSIKFDRGFGKNVEWDIPLLAGYNYEFLKNASREPGSHHFNGIRNPEIISKIELFKPDVILIYGWAYHSHLKVIRHFKRKVPIWFRGDSTLLDEERGIKSLLRSLLLKWIYSHVDRAFYVGSANRDYFKKFGMKDKQLSFSPHAIENERFSKDRSHEARELRNKLAIPPGDMVILFAGKFVSKKDPELLLEAVKRLNSSCKHLLFVGNGALEENLKVKAYEPSAARNENRPPLNIHFLPFQNQTQMPVIYQACDLFCLPSSGPGETWGLAVNEAMAAGKAILVSDKAGCSADLVQDGINGYIFESKNLNDLSAKLKKFGAGREQLVTMGKESFRIIQNWSFSKQVDSLIGELNNL